MWHKELILKKISIICLLSSVVFWLMLNYGAGKSCDEIWQIFQWREFCWRGIVACTVIFIFLFVRLEKRNIVYTIEFSIIAVCVAEAVYSMLQLYGFLPSQHGIFKVTGSFYNPGPLGGFLAISIPLAINRIINLNEISESKFYKYALYISLSIIVISLPSTMSRTAWIAAAVATVYVLYCNKKIQPLIGKTKIRPQFIYIGVAVCMIIGAFFLWHIKKDSAVGRLLLWKISAKAVCDAPILGSSDFANAYSKAQEEYFAQGDATLSEKLAAGSPDYAFNEYLQIAVEYGIPMLVLVLGILFFALRKSYREQTFGLSGALISIMVFAYASYPMHIPVFVAVVGIVLFGIVIYNASGIRQKLIAATIPLAIIIISALKLPCIIQKHDAIIKWSKMQFSYQHKSFHDVTVRYSDIYESMNWNPRFMYEYGHSLYKTKKYDSAIPILENAAMHSTDPMPLNILGECHQALQQYDTAENYYRRAAMRIPSRLYPHYLLYFLYDETGDTTRRRAEYEQVMGMTIKTESPATRDLRRKVEENEKK